MARDPLRKLRPPTDKQRAARDRNWRVWKLRGLWWNAFPMTGEHLAAYRAAIDAQLIAVGAEPEKARVERRRLENETTMRRWAVIEKLLNGEYLS